MDKETKERIDIAIHIIQTQDVPTRQERAHVLSVLQDYRDQPEPEPAPTEIDGNVVLDYFLESLVHKYAELYMDDA